MNNPVYLNMSDSQLIAHIANLAKKLLSAGLEVRIIELRNATEELDYRFNRS